MKKVADGSLYDQIFTTDEDRLLLERFWNEASNAATELFKPFLVSVSTAAQAHGVDLSQNYVVVLALSSAFDTSLEDSIQSSLFSFFTNFLVSRWFKFANKDEAEGFAEEAAAMLEDVKSKIYYRKKPTRVAPN